MCEPIFFRKICRALSRMILRPISEEIMLDFIAIEHGIMGEDLLKEYPQLGNVPLPVAEVVDEIPDCFLGRYLEGIVEAVVGGEDLQVGIQHHQRLAHGFHDVLGIFPGILDFRFQLLAFICRYFKRGTTLAKFSDLMD